MNIGIYIYDQAEVLDFSGPFEVFTTASRVSDEDAPFSVFLIAEKDGPITARAGYQVLPNATIDNHPPIDILIIVGGVHTGEMANEKVKAWIADQAAIVQQVATVCTGIFLVANAQPSLKGRVTTHWDDQRDLQAQFPQLDVVEDVRWVDDGGVISSGGISAGIDMCLHLVAKLRSPELAEKTARQMEYRWNR
ncbi:glutamine amidotransferase [Vreelandella alkaliphila]|uniref:DJ-1/PfpI family protein n=1 Tax=Vreelandella alkaliphila TaxID=272774 RepID=UPI000EA28F62|nr:DJ-1/PfpI family protein [Halomonas alkaliphila]AYF35393.1 glutamine amidotransferase [Halomonas alkaliphila]